MLARLIFGGRLALSLRQADQADAPAGKTPHDVVGAVGAGVRHHEHTAPVRGIVEREQRLESPGNDPAFVVHRQHDGELRPGFGIGNRHRPPPPGEEPEQRRIPQVGVNQKQHGKAKKNAPDEVRHDETLLAIAAS